MLSRGGRRRLQERVVITRVVKEEEVAILAVIENINVVVGEEAVVVGRRWSWLRVVVGKVVMAVWRRIAVVPMK